MLSNGAFLRDNKKSTKDWLGIRIVVAGFCSRGDQHWPVADGFRIGRVLLVGNLAFECVACATEVCEFC